MEITSGLDLIKTVMNLQKSIHMDEKTESNSDEELPPWFMPSELDVICGWARQNYHHAGNRRLRDIIDENIEVYDEAKNRADKGRIIIEIVERLKIESPTGIGLVKYNRGSKRWSYIGKEKAKDKIGHALRKASQDKQKLLEGGGSFVLPQSQPRTLVAKKKKQAHQTHESSHAPGFSFVGDSSPLEEAFTENLSGGRTKQKAAVSQPLSRDSVSQYSIDYTSSEQQEFAYPCTELQSRATPQEVPSLAQSVLQSPMSRRNSMANSNMLMVQEAALQLQQQGINAPNRLSGSQKMAHIDLSTDSSFTHLNPPIHLHLPTTLPSRHHQLQHQSDMRMTSEQHQDDVSAQFPFVLSSLSAQLQSGNQQSSTMSLSRSSDQLVQQEQQDDIRGSSHAPRFLHQLAGTVSSTGVANHVSDGGQASNLDLASSSRGNLPLFVAGDPVCEISQGELLRLEILRTMVSDQQQHQQDLSGNNSNHFQIL